MKFPLSPRHPERVCWGCEKLCPADDLRCGNGTERAQHPIELFGEDWYELEKKREEEERAARSTLIQSVKPALDR